MTILACVICFVLGAICGVVAGLVIAPTRDARVVYVPVTEAAAEPIADQEATPAPEPVSVVPTVPRPPLSIVRPGLVTCILHSKDGQEVARRHLSHPADIIRRPHGRLPTQEYVLAETTDEGRVYREVG